MRFSKATLFLFLIILIGTILRINNLSPLKIYPDAYQNFLVAENLKKTGTVFGTLGENGYSFPPFLIWTRPGFPILTNLADYFINDLEKSSEFVTLMFGILVVPLSFFLIKSLFHKVKPALFGSLLLASSWNHIVWGGFLGTETLGVFASLLLIFFFFKSLNKKSNFAELHDFYVGIFFSFAVLVRYEYFLLIIPMFLLIIRQKITPIPKILNILAVSVLLLSIAGVTILPLDLLIENLNQLNHPLIILAVFLFAFIISFVSYRLLFLTGLGIVIFAFYFKKVPYFGHFAAAFDFFKNDFFLGIALVTGFISLIKIKKYQSLNLFLYSSLILLSLVYHQINPYMQRYWTHLLPFLIILASAGFYKLSKWNFTWKGGIPGNGDIPVHRSVPIIVLFILFLLQTAISARGLKYWKNGEYFRTSYEEKSAKILSKQLEKGSFLLASFPEPYYFFSHIPTQSIADIPPFIYFENPPEREITIIEDMGMRDIFPKFSKFLDNNLEKYKSGQYKVGENYHFAERSELETHPVIIYKIPFGDLKNLIK